MEFQESYWPDALKTLRREERKAFLRRWWPLALLVLLLTSAGGWLALPDGTAPADQAVALHAPAAPEVWAVAYPTFIASGAKTEITAVTPTTVSTDDRAPEPEMTSEVMPQNEAGLRAPDFSSHASHTTVPMAAPAPAASTLEQPNTVEPAELTEETRDAAPVETLKRTQAATAANEQLPATVQAMRQAVLSSVSTDDPATDQRSTGTYEGLRMRMLPPEALKVNMVRNATGQREDTPSRWFPWKHHHWFLTAGNSFLQGYGARTEAAFNPEVSVGYAHYFAEPRWAARASLQYFQIGGITHVAHFDQTELGFGATTTRTSIATEKLHFAALPVELTYQLNRRIALNGGIALSYLVNGLSEVTISEITSGSEAQLEQFEEYGYTGGYKPLNAAMLAGAEFRVVPNCWLGGSWQYGLTRITRETIYGVNDQDRNSRLRLYLKFDLP